jgi:hypothetical protein
MTRLYERFRATAQAAALVGTAWMYGRHDRSTPQTWPVGDEIPERAVVRWPATYEWPAAQKWVEALRGGLAARLPLISAEIAQPYEGVVLIEFELDGVRHEVAIDYFDRDRILDQVVQRCPLVLKMQYSADGYGYPHVVPGGYVPGHASIYRYLPALRHLRDHARTRFGVYGRFGLDYAPDIRRKAVELLRSQDRFQYEGSLAILPYGTYLREAALSRVCVDLPGNGEMCHRLVDYLAIGCCIVRPLPGTRLHVPLEDGLNIRYARADLSDFVDACADLADDSGRSIQLGLAAREYFDRYLHPDQLAGYYIDRCVSILGS